MEISRRLSFPSSLGDATGPKPRGLPISSISISGFKSFAESTELELADLTVLAGANSSGKSSALQPLLLLKQTLELQHETDTLHIAGPNVRFTHSYQFLSDAGARYFRDFEIGVRQGLNKTTWSFRFGYRNYWGGLVLKSVTQETEGQAPFVLKPRLRAPERSAIFRAIKKAGKSYVWRGAKSSDVTIKQRRIFLEASIRRAAKGSSTVSVETVFGGEDLQLSLAIRNLIHVPALRGNPARNYPRATAGSAFPGRFDDYVASIIHQWEQTEDQRFKELGKNLEELGLASDLSTMPTDETSIQLRVGRLPVHKRSAKLAAKLRRRSQRVRQFVDVSDVGFGVSQVLPVLVALLAARPGQSVYIEQPEIHLHPTAQGLLAQVICRASKRGVRVIIETHSEQLLLGLQTVIAEKAIEANKVLMHWFSRDPETGTTQVNSVVPDSAGSFGRWPVDFGSENLKAQNRYLTAARNARLK